MLYKKFKLYVAGASKEIDMIEMYIKQLEESHINITHNWCKVIRSKVDRVLSNEELIECALEDLRGVDVADGLWLMIPGSTSIGCYVELGYAIAIKRQIIISGKIFPNNIFCMDKRFHRFETHKQALDYICFNYGQA